MKYPVFVLSFFCALLAVEVNAQGLKDTVYVTPQRPTSKDSLFFNLFNLYHSCCTQYYSKNVSVTDTIIMLSYEYSDSNKCMCFAAGSNTAFSCGPQKAGRYAIYKSESAYCPGPICPAGPIMFERVGEVTVQVPTSIVPLRTSNAAAAASFLSIVRSSAGTLLQLHLDMAQRVSVAAYSVNGACLAKLVADKYLSQGTHFLEFNSPHKLSGVVIVRAQGETFSTSKIIRAAD